MLFSDETYKGVRKIGEGKKPINLCIQIKSSLSLIPDGVLAQECPEGHPTLKQSVSHTLMVILRKEQNSAVSIYTHRDWEMGDLRPGKGSW